MAILRLMTTILLTVTPLASLAQVNDTQPKNFEEARAQQDLLRRFPQDTRLTILALNGQQVALGDKSIMTFNKGSLRMQGFGGCNSVSADFRVSPRQIRFGPLSFTTNGCDEARRKAEIAVFKAIQNATHWTPDGHERIILHGKSGKVSFGPAF